MLSVIIFCFLAANVLSINLGSIHVEGYGEVWVHGTEWSDILVHNNGFTLRGNSFVYFASGPEDDRIWKTPLMDRNFTYTVDLSALDCDCVVSAFFTAMTNYPEDGEWCGAQTYKPCPEYSILEASSFAATSSLHICSGARSYLPFLSVFIED